MDKTRILLTVEHQLQSQLLSSLLSSLDRVEIVGEANEVIDILRHIERKKPHIWMHSWEQGPALEAVLSHVGFEQSELAVIRMAPDEVTGFFQVQNNSLADLLRLAQSRPGTLVSA